MKCEIPIRITVAGPPKGVLMRVQRGRDELLPPASSTGEAISFEFPVSVDLSSGQPNFLGKFAQGPKNSWFVYSNSGNYAGQPDSCWSRRAKISLMNITREQIEDVIASPESCLAIRINGTGRDGGPVCASVKLNGDGWKVTGR